MVKSCVIDWRKDTFFGFLELFEIAKPWTGTLCDGDAESHTRVYCLDLLFIEQLSSERDFQE